MARYAPLILFLFLCFPLFADHIEFADGVSSTTTVLDTTGCKVKIRQHGNIVDVDKKDITTLTVGAITLSYAGFECTPEKAQEKPAQTFDPGYNGSRVYEVVQKLPKHDTAFKTDHLYYFKYPVTGAEFLGIWDSAFAAFEKTILRHYPNAKPVDSETLWKLVSGKSADSNCVLIPLEAKFGYYSKGHSFGDFSADDLTKGSKDSTVPSKGLSNPLTPLFSPDFCAKVRVRVAIIDLKNRRIISDLVSTNYESENADLYNGFFSDGTDEHSEKSRKLKLKSLKHALNRTIKDWRNWVSLIHFSNQSWSSETVESK